MKATIIGLLVLVCVLSIGWSLTIYELSNTNKALYLKDQLLSKMSYKAFKVVGGYWVVQHRLEHHVQFEKMSHKEMSIDIKLKRKERMNGKRTKD